MATTKLSEGTAHKIPADLRKALTSDARVSEKWNNLTPLARNEFICWVISVQKAETREEHIQRTKEDLLKGKRRPCCWMGCPHRTDKPMNASQKWILGKKSKPIARKKQPTLK